MGGSQGRRSGQRIGLGRLWTLGWWPPAPVYVDGLDVARRAETWGNQEGYGAELKAQGRCPRPPASSALRNQPGSVLWEGLNFQLLRKDLATWRLGLLHCRAATA